MTCDEVRVAVSARIDGEPAELPPAVLDAHLAGCSGCRAWQAAAERITRAVRVQPVAVPDLTGAVLAAAELARATETARAEGVRGGGGGRRPDPDPRVNILRIAVAVTAVAQLALAVPVLLGGLGVVDDAHTGREIASFDVALAVGFAFAAFRPHRAQAYVPVAIALALCLAATGVFDVVHAHTAVVPELGHLAALLQAGLLWALGRVSRMDGPAPAGPTRAAALAP